MDHQPEKTPSAFRRHTSAFGASAFGASALPEMKVPPVPSMGLASLEGPSKKDQVKKVWRETRKPCFFLFFCCFFLTWNS